MFQLFKCLCVLERSWVMTIFNVVDEKDLSERPYDRISNLDELTVFIAEKSCPENGVLQQARAELWDGRILTSKPRFTSVCPVHCMINVDVRDGKAILRQENLDHLMLMVCLFELGTMPCLIVAIKHDGDASHVTHWKFDKS